MSDTADSSDRDWRRLLLVVGVAVFVVLAVLAGSLWLYSEHLYRSSYESGYDYELALTTNESLENVTLYLPVPAGVEDPDLAGRLVEEGNTAGGNFSYAIVDTRYGPMLRVTAERVAVTPRYYEFVEEGGRGERVEIPASEYDPSNPNMTRDANEETFLTVSAPTDESVETDAPWGAEPLLTPRYDRRPAACDFPAPDWLRCYEYDSRVYASYEANDTAQVNVLTRVEGRNAWWVFGWSADSYRDGVSTELRGPRDGWSNVTGTLAVDTERRRPPTGRTANASA